MNEIYNIKKAVDKMNTEIPEEQQQSLKLQSCISFKPKYFFLSSRQCTSGICFTQSLQSRSCHQVQKGLGKIIDKKNPQTDKKQNGEEHAI